MPSSNRIIRGQDAAELQGWSVKQLGPNYNTPVERLFGEIFGNPPKEQLPELTDHEIKLREREEALQRREQEIAELERETLKQAEERGRQSGYEAGWNAAHNERVALLNATKTIEDEFERFKSVLSEKLLDLVVLVSKKVLANTLTVQTEQAAELLNQILESMQLHGKAITLRAHPHTIAVLEAQFGDQQMLGNLRMISDPKQLQGGFVLQHPEGEVDASLQSRWLHAIESLGRDTPLKPDDLDDKEAE